MKFGILQQILNPIAVTWPKIEIFEIFKIQDGGDFIDQLSDFSEILYEEGERHVDKGYETKKCKFLKSKMADGRHFENR